jgi:hypothetical protein
MEKWVISTVPGKKDFGPSSKVLTTNSSPIGATLGIIAKRSKKKALSKSSAAASTSVLDPQKEHACAAAAFTSFLAPENLLPKLPTREDPEMEGVLSNLRKHALVEEYFGGDD